MILHGYDSNVIMDVTRNDFLKLCCIKEYKEYELRCLDFCLSVVSSVCPKKNFLMVAHIKKY